MENELNVENTQVAGYMHFYIKDGNIKSMSTTMNTELLS